VIDHLRIRLAILYARLVQRLIPPRLCGHCSDLARGLEEHVLDHARARGMEISRG
jgi:hypothetical protein